MSQRVRNALFLSSAGALFLLLVVSLTPITSPLPPYVGEYEVGILDIETEVERRVIHDAVLKETGDKAFEVRGSRLEWSFNGMKGWK
jgi:platelet-activating factor acetylhydrolase